MALVFGHHFPVPTSGSSVSPLPILHTLFTDCQTATLFPVRYVVIYVADEYDAVHCKGAFFPLTVGVGLAADPHFREHYEAKSGLKKPTENEGDV
jgi:hypothetical protein